MVTLNLTVPIILSKLLLKSLKNKSGIIINIASIEAIRYSKFSALYSSTKAGLRSFSLSLFEEVRKYGVKIVVINPDMTKTNFFNKLSFNVGDNKLSYLEVFDIKEIVKTILNTNVNCCLTEITVRPQKIEIKKQKN
jgi:short-subunit dehydrogenase